MTAQQPSTRPVAVAQDDWDEQDDPTTPITNAVRDEQGDYLAAVEDLERSHADLLAALKDIAGYMEAIQALATSVLHEAPAFTSKINRARAAIRKATGQP